MADTHIDEMAETALLLADLVEQGKLKSVIQVRSRKGTKIIGEYPSLKDVPSRINGRAVLIEQLRVLFELC